MKFGLSLLVVPLLGQQGVNFHSLKSERALGEQLASEIRRQAKPLGDPGIDAYVKRLGGELVAQLSGRQFDYGFEVILDRTRTEPFSLPGGYIFIPAHALIGANNEAEFVGMLAHSIGHVALRHGTRMATRAEIVKMAGAPLVYMGGRAGAHADAQGPERLAPAAFLQFQRTYELEADRFGLELAARAGYDPAAFRRYIERMQVPDSNMSPLPARDRRLSLLEKTLSSLRFSTTSSSGQEFPRIQEAVRSIIGHR
jgi:predicted Zn-dependent protease